MPALPQKFFVTLIRDATIGPRTWDHSTKNGAASRAHALCHLHGVREATYNDRTFTFTVDASAFYKRGV